MICWESSGEQIPGQDVIYIVLGGATLAPPNGQCRSATVKAKVGAINSFEPAHISSLACSLFPLLPLFSGEENCISACATTKPRLQTMSHAKIGISSDQHTSGRVSQSGSYSY